MNKKLLGVTIIIIVLLISINVFKDDRKITIPINEVTSGYVLSRHIGGAFQHDLSSSEIEEFINVFNNCNFTEGDHKKTSLKHTALSDSIDVVLQMNNGTQIYFMAFSDGEIYVNDLYNYKEDYSYSLDNKKLLKYIRSMREYFTPDDFKGPM
jgi:hypothetical protein